MSRNESLVFKGVAILMMIFYHLFDQGRLIADYKAFLFVDDGIPLVYFLAQATNPVGLFLFLGGYGLYSIYKKGTDKRRYSRIIGLYLHYWVILIVFVSVALFFLNINFFEKGVSRVISNFLGFGELWNNVCWFLLPYSLLSISAPVLFRITDRLKMSIVLIISIILYYVMAGSISFYHASFLRYHQLLYLVVLYFELMSTFLLGMLAKRCGVFEKLNEIKNRGHKWFYPSLLLVLLFLVKCVINSAAWGQLYNVGIICLLYLCKRPNWLDMVLLHLGKHSMNMWLIHGWFCYVLFHDFIYSFTYPVLIFVALTAISYACSHVVNLIIRALSLIKLAK